MGIRNAGLQPLRLEEEQEERGRNDIAGVDKD